VGVRAAGTRYVLGKVCAVRDCLQWYCERRSFPAACAKAIQTRCKGVGNSTGAVRAMAGSYLVVA